MRVNDPRGVASSDTRGLIRKIYVGDHYTLIHTKCISSRPYCFREEDFLSFSRGQFELQGLDWQELCRGPLNILNI